MTENEKEQHAMEFFDWALRHEVLLFCLQGDHMDDWVDDYIELLQILYNEGYYEACVLCVLLAKDSAFVSSAMTDTVQKLVCSEWKSQGSKKCWRPLSQKSRAPASGSMITRGKFPWRKQQTPDTLMGVRCSAWGKYLVGRYLF